MRRLLDVYPGIFASVAITGVAQLLVAGEKALTGYELIDGLVFAIVLGTLCHTIFGLHPALRAGVTFSSKIVLELAIVLLGASVSVATVATAGAPIILMVIGIVLLSLLISYWICRMLGLHDQLATLVACGNSICGNSAIVAAAPVIGARSDDVASSIAFTAALGIVVVLALPPLFPATHFSQWQYGVFAGMTVYAVPQVLAATTPIGAASVQIGTLVKLMRVLMLGPVVLLLRLRNGNQAGARLSVAHLLPWFIVGFFLMMALRSFELIPSTAAGMAKAASAMLTTVSMAALGLSVNMRTVFASGGRVLLAGVLSMLALSIMSIIGLTFVHMQ